MTTEQWETGYVKTLGVYLNGDGIQHPDSRGRRIADDTFYVLFNAHSESVDFTLPPADLGESWMVELSTADPAVGPDDDVRHEAGATLSVPSWSLVVLRRE